jgi:hypothetical protein
MEPVATEPPSPPSEPLLLPELEPPELVLPLLLPLPLSLPLPLAPLLVLPLPLALLLPLLLPLPPPSLPPSPLLPLPLLPHAATMAQTAPSAIRTAFSRCFMRPSS